MNAPQPAAILPGKPFPFGAHATDGGVNVAVFSEHASSIELCVFDAGGLNEQGRYSLFGPSDGVFHGLLPDAEVGLIYGLRARGPFDPDAGHCFNANKLLLDPYAREIVGRFVWSDQHLGYALGHWEGTRTLDARDNAMHALKARVAAPDSPGPGTRNRPHIDAADMVIYEVHVKGFTKTMSGIPAAMRGTFAGMAHPSAIGHLKALGVTTLSLLPVHYSIDEQPLVERGLTNYWGYNSLGFFSADPRLSSHRDSPDSMREEFRQMVAELHAHGFEVVIDVVFNHTAEGDETGPTISFRGLDNASWYLHKADDSSRCENYSHCGNTMAVAHLRVTQFVLDSLRYWVEVMGVDGFRFDLAPVLGRNKYGFDPESAFFVALRQDPTLVNVRLIAEPWDGGPDGYQAGRFPSGFLEWNDRFRDAVRRYWLSCGVTRGEFARRFSASSDLFHHGSRRPSASINFISAHDGFTLADVVSYSKKHNLCNGEHNRDGRDDEVCANFGVEGPTTDPHIIETRRRVRRALLATLLLGQGTPMLHAGDELGNSQRGNNNAYCQDSPLGWIDWDAAEPDTLAFVRELLRIRRSEPLLRNAEWFATSPTEGSGSSIVWLTPAGLPMQIIDWNAQSEHAFACQLRSADGAPHSLLIIFSPEPVETRFDLINGPWQRVLDSSAIDFPNASESPLQGSLIAPARSLLLLRSVPPNERFS